MYIHICVYVMFSKFALYNDGRHEGENTTVSGHDTVLFVFKQNRNKQSTLKQIHNKQQLITWD